MVHRQIGNQALYNLHQNALLQPKLSLGQPDDFYEREADRIADQVMQMNSSGYAKVTSVQKTAQPKCAECSGSSALCPKCEDKEKIQRTALTETEIPQAQLNTPDEEDEDSVIQTKSAGGQQQASSISPAKTGETQSEGQPLPASVKNFFEPRFGRDFGSVKIHTSAGAEASAAGLRAKAYTIGNHIVFGKGQFSPDTGTGKKLIAHELTHTLQQDAGRNLIQRKCDPAIVSSRTIPVFFPQEKNLMEVYSGRKEIKKGSKKFAAIGLVQQALSDLGYPMGTTGQNKEGVDRDFKDDTETAVTAFQTAESVTGFTPGVIDQATLKCLDEIRSERIVPEHQKALFQKINFA